MLLKWNIPFTFPKFNFNNKILVWGKKVQELTFRKGGILRLTSVTGEQEYRPDAFDHAYARIPDSDDFYFVPMRAFVENGKIGDKKSCQGMKISIDMTKASKDYEWIDQYRFNLNDNNIYDIKSYIV